MAVGGQVSSFYRKENKCRKVTLYIPEDKMDMLNDVKKIFAREAVSKKKSSLSHFFVEKMEEYKRLHEPGNPQQRLDVVMQLGKAYHAPNQLCQVRDCLRDVAVVLMYSPPKQKPREVGMCGPHGCWYLSEFSSVYKYLVKPEVKQNEKQGPQAG